MEGGQLAQGPDGQAVRVGGLRPGATVVGADMPAIASDDGHPGVAHWSDVAIARKLLGWPKRCNLAHAFL